MLKTCVCVRERRVIKEEGQKRIHTFLHTVSLSETLFASSVITDSDSKIYLSLLGKPKWFKSVTVKR